MKKEPNPRYGGPEGIKVLSKFFGYSIDPFSQDWTYEVSEPERIIDYIKAYETESFDEDTKFSLMEMIFSALDNQPSDEEMKKYWKEVRPLLEKDFALHEYTIYHWCCFDPDFEGGFKITENMRNLWASHSKN